MESGLRKRGQGAGDGKSGFEEGGNRGRREKRELISQSFKRQR